MACRDGRGPFYAHAQASILDLYSPDRVMSENRFLVARDALGYSKAQCTPHGFRSSFRVSAELREQRLFLRFSAVDYFADVWLNGHHLGTHEGGYTPFEFDVTEHVRWDAANTLTVVADNTYKRGAWWPWLPRRSRPERPRRRSASGGAPSGTTRRPFPSSPRTSTAKRSRSETTR